MKILALVITASLLGYFALEVFILGFVGLRTNFVGSSLTDYSIDSLYSGSEDNSYKYVRVREARLVDEALIYSDQFQNVIKTVNPIIPESEFQKLKAGDKITVKFFAEFQSEPSDTLITLTGIADKITNDEASDLLTLNNSFMSMDVTGTIIRTNQSPRQWYWNLLLTLIPVLYVIGLTRAIINMVRGKPIGIPENKIP